MIRNIDATDFDFIYGLYMHPEINPFLLYEPMPKLDFEPIYEDLLKQNIIFIYYEAEQNIGMFKLIQLQHRTSHINYIGGLGIHPDFNGLGHGSKMIKEIIDLGKKRGLKRLELSAATFNTKAIKLYEKHGFVLEGIMKNYTHVAARGEYIDEQLMAYLF